MSGISEKIPAVLKAPIFFDDLELVNGILCYVIRDYGTAGLSLLVYRVPTEDKIHVVFGDWNGKHVDVEMPSDEHKELAQVASVLLDKYLQLIVNVMHSVKLCQAQYFFAVVDSEPVLVDIQLSANIMTGPGMLRDIFAKVIPTQEIITIKPIDSIAKESILNNSGSFKGNIILKPSKFRLNSNTQSPLYVRIKR